MSRRSRTGVVSRLLSSTGELFSGSLEVGVTLSSVVDLVVPGFADMCSIHLRSPEGCVRLAAVAHVDPAQTEFIRSYRERYPVRKDDPRDGVGRVLTTGQPILSVDVTAEQLNVEARDEAQLATLRSLGVRSAMVVPMTSRDRTLGAMSFASLSEPFTRADLEAATEIARRAALAVDNAQLFEAERATRLLAEKAERRLAFLVEASERLSGTLEPQEAFDSLVQIAVPRIADFAIVVDAEFAVMAYLHADPSRAETMRQLMQIPAAPRPVGPMAHVLLHGAPIVFPDVTDETIDQSAADPEKRRLARLLEPRSAMIVPLAARGRVLGAMVLASSREGRRYTVEDLALATEVGRRAALAIDNTQLLEEARMARDAAMEAVRVRDEFLNIAGHELRTPITALQLQIFALREMKLEPARAAEMYTRATRQLARLTGLVNQLLEVSRIDQRELVLEREALDAGIIVRESVDRMAEETRRSGSTVTVVAEPLVIGQFDRVRLDQVVANLLSNALKYGRGRPIEVTVSRADAELLLTVQDHGNGIAALDQQNLFEQATRSRGGLGIGLWISRRIVEAHGGQISVKSTPGEGALLKVVMPLIPTEP